MAVVVADTPYHAQDAAELVDVAYDPLPCVVDAADCPAPLARRCCGRRIPGNLAFRFRKGDPDSRRRPHSPGPLTWPSWSW